jgi:hypothetical protein
VKDVSPDVFKNQVSGLGWLVLGNSPNELQVFSSCRLRVEYYGEGGPQLLDSFFLKPYFGIGQPR